MRRARPKGKAGGEAGAVDDDEMAEINKLIDQKQMRSVFQPLVDLRTHDVFAYEALARTDVERFKSPPVMFDAAIRAGRVGELGRTLRRLAIDNCTEHPLFLNVNPHEFDEGWLVQPDDPIYWHADQVYIEITESVPLRYFDQCQGVLAEARHKGVRLAVDDLGAGYSNFKYISDLTPEIVKLDRELIAGLAPNTRLFKLVRNIVRLCNDMGAKTVGEGVETLGELRAVIEAGVDYAQGYLLARPQLPPPAAVWPDDPEDAED